MKIPTIRGIIDRRVLANWRVDAGALKKILPEPFRAQVVDGWGIAGVCLIRLKGIRPFFLPPLFGMSSENAAHRIAVEWDENGEVRRGVYVPRRDSGSRFNALVGGRLFPGVHHHARFDVNERDDAVRVEMNSDDRHSRILVEGRVAGELPKASVFGSLQRASEFFEAGSVGYSATREVGRFDGLELRCRNWQVHALDISRIESSFFTDANRFGRESAIFDCALLMRKIDHEWHAREPICCA